jgi:hypothetical protein
VKQESTGNTFTVYYPLTLVSQCTTHWLLFHIVLPIDSCFTVYYLLTLVSQCTTRWLFFSTGSTMWNKSQQAVRCETRVNAWYTVKQESTGSTMWNKSQRVSTLKQESTVYYLLTLVSQCTTRWLFFHSVLPVDSCFTVYYPLTLRVNGYYIVKQESTGSTLWNKSQRVVHCETRVNG